MLTQEQSCPGDSEVWRMFRVIIRMLPPNLNLKSGVIHSTFSYWKSVKYQVSRTRVPVIFVEVSNCPFKTWGLLFALFEAKIIPLKEYSQSPNYLQRLKDAKRMLNLLCYMHRECSKGIKCKIGVTNMNCISTDVSDDQYWIKAQKIMFCFFLWCNYSSILASQMFCHNANSWRSCCRLNNMSCHITRQVVNKLLVYIHHPLYRSICLQLHG